MTAVHRENYPYYEMQCPYCKVWEPMLKLTETEIWCEECNDFHDGFECQHCGEDFDHARGRRGVLRKLVPKENYENQV